MKQKDPIDEVINQIKVNQTKDGSGNFMANDNEEILGYFDGQNMQGDDDNNYPIPCNYASKSKLVEGDKMKLTIKDGEFIYKQIELTPRKRFIGKVVRDEAGKYFVYSYLSKKLYRIIDASINYYKLRENDDVVLVIPRCNDSQWGAVENVINKK